MFEHLIVVIMGVTLLTEMYWNSKHLPMWVLMVGQFSIIILVGPSVMELLRVL